MTTIRSTGNAFRQMNKKLIKMLYNTSYRNKEYIKESNDAVGKSYSIIDKIKIGGVGSGRMVIEEFSQKLAPENMQEIDVRFANIELRPKGIIIHFPNRLERFSWVIPYYRLVLYSTKTFSVHANGNYIQFKKNKHFLSNKKFISKMTTFKNEFISQGYPEGVQ